MVPEAFVSHVSSGRIRIKIPSKRGDGNYFASLQDRLPEISQIPGIRQVEMKPVTGSVLVIHQTDLKPNDLKAMTDYLGLFRMASPEPDGKPVSRNIAKTFQDVNQKLKDFTKGEIDLQSVALLGLVGLGLFQISQGRVTIPAISAFWYSSTLLKDQAPKTETKSVSVKED